ncbi:hypothetical protein DL93DRAFT_213689 [Clavulina sp. PMI_390]|nr:hypothetical protein DL93DRAFT_213689 [Clavulina sp. PMI_390]
MSGSGTMTPRTPGTPYPIANQQAVADLLMLMKSNLNTLGATFDSLGEQSAKVATLGPAMETAHQIHQLRRQMRQQEKHQDSRINDIRSLVQDTLKVQIAEHMRAQIDEEIRREIAGQVKDEVTNQIATHLPIPLAIQAAESQEQLAEVRVSLQNTEARRHNSHISRSNLEEDLAPITMADGKVSKHYPATIKVLFSYELEVLQELLEDYGLALHRIREGCVNRFLSFIGVHFQLIVPIRK